MAETQAIQIAKPEKVQIETSQSREIKVADKPKRTVTKSTPDFSEKRVPHEYLTRVFSEDQIKTYRDDNTHADFFGKVTCGIASFTFALILDVIIQGTLTEFAKAVVYLIVPAGTVLSVAFGIKWWCVRKKVSDVQKLFHPDDDTRTWFQQTIDKVIDRILPPKQSSPQSTSHTSESPQPPAS